MIEYSVGNIVARFDESAGCVCTYVSYMGSGNLININKDRGREIQFDIIDGYIQPGDDFRKNTVNPTQGAGNFGLIYNKPIKWEVRDKQLLSCHAKVIDYSPNKVQYDGQYRRDILNRYKYPDTGWESRTNYHIEPDRIVMSVYTWCKEPRHVYAFRLYSHFQRTMFFDKLLNEKRRDLNSWRALTIRDSVVECVTRDGVIVTVRCEFDEPEFQQKRTYEALASQDFLSTSGVVYPMRVWTNKMSASLCVDFVKWVPKKYVVVRGR